MPPTLQEVLAQARLLSLADKAALANELLESLHVPDPRIEVHEKEPISTFSLDEILAKYRQA